MIHTTIAIRNIERQLVKRESGTKFGHWDWLISNKNFQETY